MATKNVAQIRSALADPQTSEVHAFALAKGISAVLNSGNDDTARELVIRALERKDLFKNLPGVLDSLVRSVGLFPYADPEALGAKERLAYEFHRADNLSLDGTDIVFHREQAEIFMELDAGRSVVLSAPTSFGKSLIIDALVAKQTYRNIVIIVPTIALIDETRRRLSRFHEDYKIITHNSQAATERNIFVLTQERAVEREGLESIDLLVIDEFYKLSPENEDDDQRSTLLNQALYKLGRRARQIYLLGPNINHIPEGFEKRFKCTFRSTDFNTVVSEIKRVKWKPDREGALIKLCSGLNEPTLIYCKSKPQAQAVAAALVAAELGAERPILSAAADWAGREYHPEWSFVAALRRGIGLHHAGVPRALAQQNVAFFNDGMLPFLVCTSSLIEGVNTAAKNVIIYEGKLSKTPLDYFTFNNIKGRSGRMRRHFVGNVFIFDEAPAEELDFVDIPAFTQGKDATMALLAQIDQEDLRPEAKVRLRGLWSQSDLSLETIRANAGIDPDAQVALAKSIQANWRSWHGQLAWVGLPNKGQLYETCNVIFDYFVGRRRDGVASGNQLAYKTLRLWALEGKVKDFIEEVLRGDKYVKGNPDVAVIASLEFQRSWAMFRLPRLLRVLERIQEEIFERMGLRPGNYAKFAADLESGFMPQELASLDEYGLPVQIGGKLGRQLKLGEGLDAAIDSLRRLDIDTVKLSTFERKVLERVRAGL